MTDKVFLLSEKYGIMKETTFRRNKENMTKLRTIMVMLFILLNMSAHALMAPTVTKKGRWVSLSSSLVVDAIIDDKAVKVCLPKLIWKEEVDKEKLDKLIREGLVAQDAVFHLYHDGLGTPKKEHGYYYASDVLLKDIDMTYTGYLRKNGFKFSVSSTPSYEDPEFLDGVMAGEDSKSLGKKLKKIEEEKEKKRENEARPGSKSTLRVATVYDVLPKGVLPHPIRSEQAKVAAIVANLKARPYKTEIIQMDPLRWASGRMGMLNEKGEIDMAKCEGQIIDFVIRVPDKSGWLTPEMLKEIKDTPCEYVLSRYKNGLEVVEGTRYLLHDIYFGKLKLSWEEWLEKHGLKCPEFVEKPEYASGVIPIEIHRVNGIFKSLDALSVCQINFVEKSNLVYPQEIMRVFPPKPKPERKQTILFVKEYTKAYQGKKVNVHLMVCPDGKSYTELGQKRIKRMMFTENSKYFDETEQTIIEGLKKE